MRSPTTAFRAELKAFQKRLPALTPDIHWKGRLAHEILAHWIDHPECEAIWTTLHPLLKVAVSPGHFISEVIFARYDAEQLNIVVREAPAIEARARARALRHFKKKNYSQLVLEDELLTDFVGLRARVIGRKKTTGPRINFMREMSAGFQHWCGQPLDNVVRVLTEIAFGQPVTIEAVRGARNPRPSRDRGIRARK